jgi:hypothetical protein
VPQHDPSELFEFSYRIFKAEYVIIKLFFFALSLYGIYQLAEHEFGFHFGNQLRSQAGTTVPVCQVPPASP